MTIEEIRTLISNRIATLRGLRRRAEEIGDIAQVLSLDAEIAETEATLAKLVQVN